MASGARVRAVLADALPTARTLDIVLAPLPANPVGHEVLAVPMVADTYVVRRGGSTRWRPPGSQPSRVPPVAR